MGSSAMTLGSKFLGAKVFAGAEPSFLIFLSFLISYNELSFDVYEFEAA